MNWTEHCGGVGNMDKSVDEISATTTLLIKCSVTGKSWDRDN